MIERTNLWWPGNPKVEPYMLAVNAVLDRYFPHQSEASTDIYNRVYEAMDTSRRELESQLASLQSRLAAFEWIPVSERLPEKFTSVLIWDDASDACFYGNLLPDKKQWTTAGGFYFHGKEFARITHWMPLPEAPKGGEE